MKDIVEPFIKRKKKRVPAIDILRKVMTYTLLGGSDGDGGLLDWQVGMEWLGWGRDLSNGMGEEKF